MNFKDQVVIITGASAGIGKATAEEFAAHGAILILADRNEKAGQELTEKLVNQGATATFHPVDVSNLASVESLFDFCIKKYNRLDHLINNAGIANDLCFFEAIPDEVWHKVIAVNQTGVFYGMRAALKIMREQGGGSIVNTASAAGIGAAPRMGAYAASKHAVVGMTKTAAHEYGKFNIRINAVCPSVIETEMGTGGLVHDPKLYKMMEMSVPMKRFGKASEVAKTICWLSSEEASYLNGVALSVDGGLKA